MFVNHGLTEVACLFGPASQFQQCITTGVFEGTQIGGVDLGMAVEQAEMLIQPGGVQEHHQTKRQRLWNAVFVLVEYVEMILKAKPCRVKGIWPYHAGHDAAFLLLG